MTPIGCELGQWQQHEGALMHSRMRDFRALFLRHHHVVEGDEVEIDDPRPPTFPADAPKGRLDPMQNAQKGTRRQFGFNTGNAVNEPGLIGTRDRCASVPGGTRRDPDTRAGEMFQRRGERGLGGAVVRARQVGAQADVDHGAVHHSIGRANLTTSCIRSPEAVTYSVRNVVSLGPGAQAGL